MIENRSAWNSPQGGRQPQTNNRRCIRPYRGDEVIKVLAFFVVGRLRGVRKLVGGGGRPPAGCDACAGVAPIMVVVVVVAVVVVAVMIAAP